MSKGSPGLAVVGLVAALLLNLIYTTRIWPVAFTLAVVVISALRSGFLVVCRRFVVVLLPFVVPLLIMHVFLNTQFEVSLYWLGVVPVRFAGAEFALDLIIKFGMIFAAMLMFFEVERGRFVDWLVSRRVPAWLYAPTAQAVSLTNLIAGRAHQVLQAQQARGIAVSPGLWRRLRALPRVIIPVVTSLIREIDPRTYAMVARGFGSHRMSAPYEPALFPGDWWAVAVFSILLFAETRAWLSY